MCVCVQELSGQQQTSSAETEFDFPEDDSAFTASEFKDEGVDFTVDHTGSSEDAGAAAGGASHVGGKQSLFDGYKDPSTQFSGQTRSYHQDARYKQSLTVLKSTDNMFSAAVWRIKVITFALGVADIGDIIISTTTA